MRENLLEVKDLRTSFRIQGKTVQAVRGVDFSIAPGEIVGLVGESGSGKSVTMKSIIRMLPDSATLSAKAIRFEDRDLTQLSEREMQSVRGNDISMIFQDPMTSLNPLRRVGEHIVEVLRRHNGISAGEAWRQAVEMLGMVGVPSPEERMKQYPHEFSGGMRQRVLIAMALACKPKLLIADEPTTALDVTIQAQILDLIRELQKKTGMAVVLITHDLGIVASLCQRLMVMYGGLIMETGTIEDIFYRPMHPYTRALPALGALHRLRGGRAADPHRRPGAVPDRPAQGLPVRAPLPDARAILRDGDPGLHRIRRGPARALPGGRKGGEGMSALLEAEGLKKYFTIRGSMGGSRVLKAVDGVSLAIEKGETFGLVGESGCGKTTLGRTMIRLYGRDRRHAEVRGHGHHAPLRQGAGPVQAADADHLSGPVFVAQPVYERGGIDRGTAGSPRKAEQARAAGAHPAHAAKSGHGRGRAGKIPPRVLRRPSASASASPGRWWYSQNSSCATSPSPPWTCPSRRRWSTCWRTCRRRWG